MRNFIYWAWAVVFLASGSASLAGDFPYRDKYPEVQIVELNELKSGYDRNDFLFIDVRTQTEFEIIHVKGAVNLSYADANFVGKLRDIVSRNPGKKIAVYDNGIDCIKAYKAAEDSLYAMIPNVYVFDAGVESWAGKFPAAALLFGKELVDPGKQLISDEQFQQRNLDFETFKEKAGAGNAVIIDARDPIQRVRDLPGVEKNLDIPVDKLVGNIISKGHLKDKKLFIYDQVGRQVNWLMYYLVAKGYKEYYFLAGGATSVLKEQEYRVAAVR